MVYRLANDKTHILPGGSPDHAIIAGGLESFSLQRSKHDQETLQAILEVAICKSDSAVSVYKLRKVSSRASNLVNLLQAILRS